MDVSVLVLVLVLWGNRGSEGRYWDLFWDKLCGGRWKGREGKG